MRVAIPLLLLIAMSPSQSYRPKFHTHARWKQPVLKSRGSSGIQNAVDNPDWLWPKYRPGNTGHNYPIWMNRDWREYPTPVVNAMKEIERATCLYFGESRREGDRVEIFVGNEGNCTSEEIGRKGGLQFIVLGKGCMEKPGGILHELLSTAGFFHEEMRKDRDEHIQIFWDNIITNKKHNFDKAVGKIVTPYDYSSVMHNGPYFQSKNGEPTMQTKVDYDEELGQREGLSLLDIAKINEIYPCCKDTPGTPKDDCARHKDQCDDPMIKMICKKTCGGCTEALVAVKTSAQFPDSMTDMSSIYVGEGKIYIFGGYNRSALESRTQSNSIYLYNARTDSLSRVGSLTEATWGSALMEDSQGNILHLGGWNNHDLNTIIRFNVSSNAVELVGRLPRGVLATGWVKHKADSALVFVSGGSTFFYEVNLTTYQVAEVATSISRLIGVAWDKGDRVLLLRAHQEANHMLYSISDNDYTTFTSPGVGFAFFRHGVVSTPKSAFIVGAEGSLDGRMQGNGLYEVNSQSLEFTFWPVENYPATPKEKFAGAPTTYVPELHRVYMLGGHTRSNVVGYTYHRDVWYIDLPKDCGLPSSTTTSVISPPFDCSNKRTGFFPSPFACFQYFRCVGSQTLAFECPPSLHFNPDLGACDRPELVKCDLDCSEKEYGDHPHPYYCNFYLRCEEKEGLVLECPSTLLFDQVLRECKLPHLVNCKHSVGP